MSSSKLGAFFFGIDQRSAPTAAIVQAGMQRPEGLRHYLLAAPSRAAQGKRPLVIILHGSGASAAQVLGMAFPPSPLSVWLEIAEREQLLLVAPDGIKRRGQRAWNDGFADIASNPDVDDVGFIGAIIDNGIANHDVDPARVYVIGVSKGGMMAYRIAAELGPRIAAFAAVLAGMPQRASYPAPSTALSALLIAGDADPFIPYGGGKNAITLWFLAPMAGIEASAAAWRELAGLPPLANVECVGAHCTRHTWGNDPAALQVVLIRIEGGGHAEPSRKKRYPGLFKRFPGRQSEDFEVAEEAWAFFCDKRASLMREPTGIQQPLAV